MKFESSGNFKNSKSFIGNKFNSILHRFEVFILRLNNGNSDTLQTKLPFKYQNIDERIREEKYKLQNKSFRIYPDF